ncbi:GLPGLI family protein, partial [Chryseobacterium sp. SC28]|uniref:GLPGLI family protein n=1 Tax=Chryseobacterium sp. SC28 TaxID=2268028 RepID=UPI0029392578
ISFAQTHRFIYELEIHKKEDTVIVNMALDINKDLVKFYDYEFVKQDSIRKSGTPLQYFSPSEQLISRKRNSTENRTYISSGYDYFLITSTDKMDWKIENETKKNKNFTLHKATTNFGGRQWTAWFSTEFPFQEGPYKFQGLPGLIFEVYDSENIFHYTFLENKNLPKTFETTDFLETHYGKKPISISLNQYHKIKLDYYNNIVEVLSQFAKKGGSIASEHDVSTPEEIAKKRKALQQSIKKYYLPLEIDKVIPYPDN